MDELKEKREEARVESARDELKDSLDAVAHLGHHFADAAPSEAILQLEKVSLLLMEKLGSVVPVITSAIIGNAYSKGCAEELKTYIDAVFQISAAMPLPAPITEGYTP